MRKEAPKPESKTGKWKREQYDKYSELTGKAWCSAGQHFAPASEVKRYSGMQRHTTHRCSTCEANRAAAMKGRGIKHASS